MSRVLDQRAASALNVNGGDATMMSAAAAILLPRGPRTHGPAILAHKRTEPAIHGFAMQQRPELRVGRCLTPQNNGGSNARLIAHGKDLIRQSARL